MRKVGSAKFVYEEVRRWGEFPRNWTTEDAPAVAVDSEDNVHVLTRRKNGLLVFNCDGRFLRAWGEDLFERPHGIHIGPDDAVYCVDDWGHALYKLTKYGNLITTIETRDHPAETGYVRGKSGKVVRSGPPFNQPTGVALSPEGDLYVADGYGNARVHKFAADGSLLFSWGEPGSGPGQFSTVHGVFVDREGLVYVSDRANARIQVFRPRGDLVTIWDDVRYPDNMCSDKEGNLYVAELGNVFLSEDEPLGRRVPARITVRNSNGNVISEWGEDDPYGAGLYFAPHGIAVDSRGDIYVSEVAATYGSSRAPVGRGVLRKYVRIKD